jgi:hypothetical protein
MFGDGMIDNVGVSRPGTTLTANYLTFIKLASIRIWLRSSESTLQLACPPCHLHDGLSGRSGHEQPFEVEYVRT